jgi:hypothetical protein
MKDHTNMRQLYLSRTLLVFIASLLCGGNYLCAQNSGFELHANDKASPADVGLPSYPGATLYKDNDNSPTFNLGYAFGDSSFHLIGANYITNDPAAQVLTYYRKPLSRYGEVLECKDGKPVGSLTVTRSGLTCSDKGGHVQINGHSDAKGDELRAGTPQEFRMVGIDDAKVKGTRFTLVYVHLPKDDSDKKAR